MKTLLQDLKYGLRMLAKNPGFTIVVVLTLALGIGANTIIFCVINALFLHPSGIADPSHLFAIRVKYDKLNLKSIAISAPDFKDVQESKQLFSSAAEHDEGLNYLAPQGPQRLLVAKVSAQWFEAFGAQPLVGRTFRPEEDQPHVNQVALLAYDTWKDLFAGDPLIIGKAIQLNHEDYRIVGVMAPDFDWPRHTQLWVPLALAASEFAPDNYFNESFFVVARARPEVSPAKAEAYVQLLTRLIAEAGRLGSSYPKDSGWGMFAIPFTEYTFGDLRTPMLILLGAVGFVLLIACSNIGGLLLARASTRAKEFAVRVALGARKRDLLREALAESFSLAACGTVAGVAAAYGGIGLLIRRVPGNLSSRLAIQVDGHVLLFAALLMVFTAVFLAFVPIGEVFSHRQYGMLQEEARSVTSSRGRLRLRELLVVGQVAVALVLLVGAGLLLKSLTRLGRVDTGFDSKGLMTASIQLPENQYNNEEKQAAFYRAVSEKLAGFPGVSSDALAVALPFTGFAPSSSFDIEGRSLGPGDPGPHGGLNSVTPRYFETLRIPLRKGRYFTEDDRRGTQPVVIIDENLARQYWPNQDPVGRRVRPGSNSPWATIVGVVGHVMQSALVGDSGKGVCYYPILQQPLSQAFLIVRTKQDPAQLAGSLRAAVAAIDAGQPVADPKTLEQYVAGSLSPQRIAASLLEIFSALALFLASIGLYGVVSYSTVQRTHEIGVRMALGAPQRHVLAVVIYQGLRLALAGMLVGAVAASFIAQFLKSQLFEVGTFDPATFTVTCLILLAVTVCAGCLPVRRATKVDPMVARRYE